MSFQAQSRRARSKTHASKVNRSFYKNQLQYAPGRAQFGNPGADKHLGVGVSQSYANPLGYSIQVNPYTGDKEMFVRGTTFKNAGAEWFQNFFESPIAKTLPLPYQKLGQLSMKRRNKHSDFLSGIAKKEGVKIIYGHSRGAAVISDMNVPGAKKVGLDGAFLLTDRRKTHGMINYRQRQGFDWAIGLKAPKTVVKKGWVPLWARKRKYHSVWT